MIKNSISSLLRKIRKDRKLSQKSIAELTGFTLSSWNNWENGKANPRINNLMQICEKLNIDPSILIDTPTPPNTIPNLGIQTAVKPEMQKINKNRRELFEIKIFSLWITEFWENADDNEKAWLKIQINKCFPDFKNMFD